MDELNKRQILIEISEDKQYATITLGPFPPKTYCICPEKVVETCENIFSSYLKQTGLENLDEWANEQCPCVDFNCRCH